MYDGALLKIFFSFLKKKNTDKKPYKRNLINKKLIAGKKNVHVNSQDINM